MLELGLFMIAVYIEHASSARYKLGSSLGFDRSGLVGFSL